jgi:hypothetical protein
VQLVHHAARAALALALAGIALSGCGGGNAAVGQPDLGGPRIGAPTQLVKCADWADADVRERYGTIEALRSFAGGRTGSPAGHGATMEDDEAYDLFERWCAESYAQGFKLYKLYTRAAAFGGSR